MHLYERMCMSISTVHVCLSVYVCIQCMCICAHMHMCTYLCVYMCACVFVHCVICLGVFGFICVCACVFTHVCLCAYACVYIVHVYTCVLCACVYVFVYVCTCIFLGMPVFTHAEYFPGDSLVLHCINPSDTTQLLTFIGTNAVSWEIHSSGPIIVSSIDFYILVSNH